MHNRRPAPTKSYDIHPISIKLIKQGNPWVTIDSFSEKFNPREKFVVANNRNRPFALLLHDPTHKNVRARVWSTSGDFDKSIKNFKNDLIQRISNSINNRFDQKIIEQRNNFYLIFGEADNIPGIFVQFLNGEIIIQFYMEFWKTYQDFIILNIIKKVNDKFKTKITGSNIWIQYRSLQKEKPKCLDRNTSSKEITITEFGVKYKVLLGKYYDHGIYTDMSQTRFKLKETMKSANSVLNLFSYTGAFSMYALSLGAKDVVSVDLSEKYIDWLEENIILNKSFSKDSHHSMACSTANAMDQLIKSGREFDFIISDPPSSSSDGNTKSNALQEYTKTLPMINKLLSKNGKALIFLNTHKCPLKRFEDKINETITKRKMPLKMTRQFFLDGDCPNKKGFPEGSYLKGLLLERYDKDK
jgi:23S rRNA (cytosine1962-C5)-methyltransferase